MKALLLISAFTAASVTATIGAQEKAPRSDSTCTTYPGGRIECRIFRGAQGDSAMPGRFFFKMDSAMAKRAALGIQVRPTGTKRDTLGVFVEAVTPKGPAESAGIIEGDRIASINGVDLRTSAADIEDSYINGLGSHRLTREVQKLSPGARVNLRIFSGGRFRDVQVTAGKASDVMRLGNRMTMPGMGGMMRFDGPDGAMMFGPDKPMLRRRMEPMMKMQIEPLVLEKLRHLQRRIQLTPPSRSRIITTVDFGGPLVVDSEAPFELQDEIEPVSPAAIRELAATAIRDARVALMQLAAAQAA